MPADLLKVSGMGLLLLMGVTYVLKVPDISRAFLFLFSALTVAYRDFGSILGYVLQMWMYATPVIYPSNLIPEGWRWVLHINPMAALIEGFRSAFLGKPFDLPAIGVSCAVAAAIFVAGVAYFEKIERRFADII